jgi:hypothetical protein
VWRTTSAGEARVADHLLREREFAQAVSIRIANVDQENGLSFRK